jgi:hypothetical protein
MSARKLSRLAGFAFVLAAVFGGVGAAALADSVKGSDASTESVTVNAGPTRFGDVIWG